VCARLCIGLPLLAVLAVIVVIRTPLLGRVIAEQVGGQLGCSFRGGAYVLRLGGGLTIEDARLRVPGIEGPAAEILRADRIEVDLDWSGVPLRAPRPRGVVLHAPTFRVGVETKSGEINLDALRVPSGGGGQKNVPPRVELVGGRLEFGEYSADSWQYQRLTSLPVAGRLEPVPGPGFTVRLEQTGRASGPLGQPMTAAAGGRMLLEGKVDLAASDAELRLVNINLDEWPAEVIPSTVRDMWRRLNVQGRIESATLRYAQGQGAHAIIKVDGVAMDALVPADRPEFAGADRPLRLADVTGTIRLSRAGVDALLEGMVGDLPGRVSLKTSGTSADAPLRCEITTARFKVSESPELMPYAPSLVRKNFATFSGPTAVVDARVIIERGAPEGGVPAPLKASGSIAFENGRAAFDKFPYPFEDMNGLVVFNEEKVEIVNIRGRGPSGAILFADGSFVPPDDDAHVNIDVLVLDVPVDDVLRDALPGERRGVIDELFNQHRYDELAAKGLILPPEAAEDLSRRLGEARARLEAAEGEERAALESQIRDLERALEAPRLALGGTAELSIHIERPGGPASKFGYTADVKMLRAAMVPQAFPVPILAEDVVLRLTEESAEVLGGRFTGLTGGSAQLAARIELRDAEDNPVFRPFLTVRAEDVPVDAMLINAIPDRVPGSPVGVAGSSSATQGLSPKTLLQQLNIEGYVDCVAAITPAPDNAGPGRKIAIDVDVAIDGLRAGPDAPAGEEALRLEDLAGRIRVTDAALEVRGLRGRLQTRPPGAPPAVPAEAGAFTMDAVAAFADAAAGKPASIHATVEATGLDVAAPLEQLVTLVSPRAGELGGAIRRNHRTAGRVDVRVEASQAGSAPTDLSLRVGAARGLEFDAFGGRFGVETSAGAATLRVGGSESVAFEGFATAVAFNGRHVMDVELDGATPLLGRNSPPIAEGDDEGVRAKLVGVELESDLARAAWRAWQGTGEKAAWLEQADPRGTFDAEMTVRPRPGLPADMVVAEARGEAGGQAITRPAWSRYRFGGVVKPRSLAFMHNGAPVDLPRIDGRIIIDDLVGRFERITAFAREERWNLAIDGTWETVNAEWGSGVKVDTTFSLYATRLEAAVAALLPRKVRSMLQSTKVQVDGPLSVENARLAFWLAGRGGAAAAREHARVAPGAGTLLFDGSVAFEDLSAEAGVPIRRGTGTVDVLVLQGPGAESPKVDAALVAKSLMIGGVELTNVRGRAVSTDKPGQVVVPQVSGDCYGGRILASGVLEMPNPASSSAVRPGSARVPPPGAGAAYQVNATLAGARFAPLAAALASGGKGRSKVDSADDSRGLLDATVSLSGRIGDDRSRVGRGSVRIAGGEVVKLPGILRMIEISNFQLPSAEKLDYAQADFGLRGRVLTVEQVAVMSESLTIMGDGTVELPEMKLAMRFNSQAAAGRRIPLLSGLFEAVRNELVTTVVEGTVKQPKVRAEPLSGTRRMMANVFGDGDGRDRLDGKAVAKAARSERDRLRSRQAAPAATPTEEAPAIVLPRPGGPAAAATGPAEKLTQADSDAASRAPDPALR